MDDTTVAVGVAYALGIASALVALELRRRWRATAPRPDVPIVAAGALGASVASDVDGAAADEEGRRRAAIGAAVYAVLGAHRVVHIGEGRRPQWASLGRVILHTSHTPHHPAPPDRHGHA